VTLALVIKPGDNHVTRIEVDGNDLEAMQALVGGWLEGFPLLDAQALVNEEGKLSGLQPNVLATRLAHAAAAIHPGDEINGPMVLVSVQRGGKTGDVPDRLVESLRSSGIEVREE
jgi:hypothetical protein